VVLDAVAGEPRATGDRRQGKAVSWRVDPTRASWNDGSCPELGHEPWTNE